MKVLMINVVCGIRSTGRICTDLAERLEECGVEVRIAYGRETVPPQYQKYAIRIGTDADVYSHAIAARAFDGAGKGSLSATRKFIEWVRSYDPDVIHLHNLHGYYIHLETLFDYLRICGKKILWTMHDCWAFTGHAAFCEGVDCEKWRTGCGQCPQPNAYPGSFIDRSGRNWQWKKDLFTGIPDLTIITPSQWLTSLIKDSFLKEYPVTTIYNGIDTDKFFPAKNDFKQFYHLQDKHLIFGILPASASPSDQDRYLQIYCEYADQLEDNYRIVIPQFNSSWISAKSSKLLLLPDVSNIKGTAFAIDAADRIVDLISSATHKPTDLPPYRYSTEYLKRYESGQGSAGEGYFSTKQKWGLSDKTVILGVASTWAARKGLDCFLRLAKEMPDQYKIVLVGLDKKQLKKLPQNVLGIERTNNTEELRQLYTCADIFINPTTEDNYPTTNLEAIACGTPVITYNTGGSPEGAMIYGNVCEKNNYDQLKQMILQRNWISGTQELSRLNADYDKMIALYTT